MTKCPIPANEISRLQAVYSYDILDTLPEVDFDTITRLASLALKMPAAVIGLMDSDRLWFKSQIGLGVPELDRKIAFCAHALMTPDKLLVIEDMHQDTRFQKNPLVVNVPNIRFYAGAPLVNIQGYALGTIAVADTKPRKFSANEAEMLHDFAKLVVSTLESRNNSNRLQALALTDHLTGLPNRVNFERALSLQIAHSNRSGEPFSLFYMDLNHFKMVNDTYGHAAGDEVLARVAQVMLSQLRAGDLLARLGGDEFGMIIRGSVDETAAPLASRISEVVSKPMMLSNGKQVSIGISIGSVAYSEMIASMDNIMTLADKALYENKRS
jgi:diguanylate cyclase (GGDEF)-like protein